ncbi:MAG: hypothetical protein GY833_22605 [Aestuariibacter sp.]|nr:hypothetical protein [Aestuariibacter sp.]|tara:strand:- start:239231 stop:239956 length:726 start_codon:yes stop_codon:yes gene_type:complete
MSAIDTVADRKAKETARLLTSYDAFFALMGELGFENITSQPEYDETDYHDATRRNIETRTKKGREFTFKDPKSELHVRFSVAAPDRLDYYNDTHKLTVLIRPDSFNWSCKDFPYKPYAKPETLRRNINTVTKAAIEHARDMSSKDRFYDMNISDALSKLDGLFGGEAKLQGSKGCCDIGINYKLHAIRIDLHDFVSKGLDKTTVLERIGRHHDHRNYVLTLSQWKQHVDLLASFNATNLKG